MATLPRSLSIEGGMAAQCNCCKWCEIDDFHVRQHFASHLLKAPSRRHYTLRRPISRERERQPRLSLPAPGLRGEGGNDPSAPAASRHAQPRRVLHPPTAKAPTTTAAWPSEARHMRFARLQPGIEPPLSRPQRAKRCRGRRGRPRGCDRRGHPAQGQASPDTLESLNLQRVGRGRSEQGLRRRAV